MDTGINMLGQFQGDSSLGLGSFQESSEPSLEFSSLEDRSLSNPLEQDAKTSEQGLCVLGTGWFRDWDELNEDDRWDLEDMLSGAIIQEMDSRNQTADQFQRFQDKLTKMREQKTAYVPQEGSRRGLNRRSRGFRKEHASELL